MSKPQQIAKLETLLARVTERKSQPRPVRAVPMAAAPMPAPTAAAPVAPRLAPVPAPAPTPARPIARTPAPSAGDLPDLDLVGGDKGPSLVPSKAAAEDAGEFEIPAHAAPPQVAPPRAIELAPEREQEELEIERTPLAVATIPPARPADVYEPAPRPKTPAPTPMESAASAAAEARGHEVEEIEPAEELPPATAQRYAPPAVPAADLTRVVPMSPPARARTFRELLQRSLSLRSKH